MTLDAAEIARMDSLVMAVRRVNETIAHRLQTAESRIENLHLGWKGQSVWHESMRQMAAELATLDEALGHHSI